MHIIALLLHIATFQLLAKASNGQSSSIWTPPLDKNNRPFFTEADFKTATGHTAYSMAIDLRSRLNACFTGRKLVLSPVYADASRDEIQAFQDAIARAVGPQKMSTLPQMITFCNLSDITSIPDAALKQLQDKALASQSPKPSKAEAAQIQTFITNFVVWQWDKCVGMAWGMLAGAGSIAIEPPLKTNERDYLGQIEGVRRGFHIPVYRMEKNQFQAPKPKYNRVQGVTVNGKWSARR